LVGCSPGEIHDGHAFLFERHAHPWRTPAARCRRRRRIRSKVIRQRRSQELARRTAEAARLRSAFSWQANSRPASISTNKAAARGSPCKEVLSEWPR
jgi:hypothetical protein